MEGWRGPGRTGAGIGLNVSYLRYALAFARRVPARATAAALLGLGALLAVAVSTPVPAGAAGDPVVDAHIVSDPVAGWQGQPHADLQRFLSYMDELESHTLTPSGGSAQTAAEGWRDPSNHGDYLVIALVALSYPGESAVRAAQSANRAATTALASLCVGAQHRSAVQTGTVAGVAGGHEVSCTLGTSATGPDALGWARGNVVALMVTVNGLFTHSSLATVAREQDRAIPPAGIAVPQDPRGSGFPTWLIAVVALLVSAGAAYWVLVISPRRNRTAGRDAPGGAPVRGRPENAEADSLEASRGKG
jgi:hypothetical protein